MTEEKILKAFSTIQRALGIIEGVMTMPDCKHCRYRYWLAQLCDIHVWQDDCDKYGTDLCQKMNDPEFIKFMQNRDTLPMADK